MSLEIYGLDLRLAKKMLFTGVNLRIDKPNLVVYVIDEAGLFIEGADVNILSAGHNLNSVSDALGTALTRFMPAINNTLTVSKDGYVTSTQIIYNETPSTLSVYVQLYASEIRLKVVNNQNEPIEGATCRVLNAIGGSNNVLGFDGVDDYVQLPAAVAALLTSGTDATLELLIKLQANTPGAPEQSGAWKISTSTSISHYPYTDSVIYMDTFRNGRLTCGNNAAFDKTQWHRLTITTTPGTNGWKLYQNGVLFYQTTGLSQIYIYSAAIEIGKSNNNRFLQGDLSDLRIWNKALSQQEINELKYNRLNGNESNLVGYWDFSDGNGTTVIDKVNGNNGTIYGATWTEADESFPIPIGMSYITDTPYDTGTTNANGLTTLNYQINTIHGLEVTLPGKRRFIMPFKRTTRGLLDWQIMLSDYLATFATDRGNILINSEPENNDATFLIE